MTGSPPLIFLGSQTLIYLSADEEITTSNYLSMIYVLNILRISPLWGLGLASSCNSGSLPFAKIDLESMDFDLKQQMSPWFVPTYIILSDSQQTCEVKIREPQEGWLESGITYFLFGFVNCFFHCLYAWMNESSLQNKVNHFEFYF